ncbi:hypothetical protein ACJX0J_008775, partial [Zea mays]
MIVLTFYSKPLAKEENIVQISISLVFTLHFKFELVISRLLNNYLNLTMPTFLSFISEDEVVLVLYAMLHYVIKPWPFGHHLCQKSWCMSKSLDLVWKTILGGNIQKHIYVRGVARYFPSVWQEVYIALQIMVGTGIALNKYFQLLLCFQVHALFTPIGNSRYMKGCRAVEGQDLHPHAGHG